MMMSIKLLSTPIPEFDTSDAIQLSNKSEVRPRKPLFKDAKQTDKGEEAIPTQAVDSPPPPPVAQVVPIPDHEQNAELDTDNGDRSLNKDNEEPVSVQAEQLVIDAAEEMYVIEKGEKLKAEFDIGIQDATDMDSDVEERQIDIVLEIKLYFNVYSLPLA